MNIFDFISSILFKKQKNCLNTVDEENNFSPFMLNRWLSMYSPLVAVHCNIINRYLGIFENKKELYNFFLAVMPQVTSKRINYIKKHKEEKNDTNSDIEKVAYSLELSQREINQYIAFKQSFIKS